VADVERAWADSSIQRADRKRTLRVTADVDATVANSTEIIGRLKSGVLPRLLADHPGISYSLEGHQREQGDFFASFLRGYLMGLLAIFALLAVTLRSYIEPFIVLLAVPFGIAGACIGHAVFQTDITMYTLIGVLGVTGVVVNDSLVLLHAIAARRDDGAPLAEAALEGCTERFRPVILTTLTTFLGLLLLLMERSTHAQELKPMATALAFGEIVSTGVVLLIVPVAWVVVERVRVRMGVERSGGSVSDPDAHRATVSGLQARTLPIGELES
jgi:multidrug efflux pump subunit AcrB